MGKLARRDTGARHPLMVTGRRTLPEEQWRRVGTQLPDPQVNRTVPSPTSVLNESQKILRHSADHLQQIRANLAAYRTATSAEDEQRVS